MLGTYFPVEITYLFYVTLAWSNSVPGITNNFEKEALDYPNFINEKTA